MTVPTMGLAVQGHLGLGWETLGNVRYQRPICSSPKASLVSSCLGSSARSMLLSTSGIILSTVPELQAL